MAGNERKPVDVRRNKTRAEILRDLQQTGETYIFSDGTSYGRDHNEGSEVYRLARCGVTP